MSPVQKQELEKLVEQTIRNLYDKGIAAIDLAPLVKLHEAVKALDFEPQVASEQATDQPPMQPAEPAPVVQPMTPGAVAPALNHDMPGDPAMAWNTPDEQSGIYGRDGRRGELTASESLLARASAIIDLLIHGGDSPDHACQVITRQLLSVGIQLPQCGGDARAWKRLMNWRNNLIHYKRSGPSWDVYCSFKEQLAHIPPDQRIKVAVGERLWDQRQAEFAAQQIA